MAREISIPYGLVIPERGQGVLRLLLQLQRRRDPPGREGKPAVPLLAMTSSTAYPRAAPFSVGATSSIPEMASPGPAPPAVS